MKYHWIISNQVSKAENYSNNLVLMNNNNYISNQNGVIVTEIEKLYN